MNSIAPAIEAPFASGSWWHMKKLPDGTVQLTLNPGRTPTAGRLMRQGGLGIAGAGLLGAAALFLKSRRTGGGIVALGGAVIGSVLASLGNAIFAPEEVWLLAPGRATRRVAEQEKTATYRARYVELDGWDRLHRRAARLTL